MHKIIFHDVLYLMCTVRIQQIPPWAWCVRPYRTNSGGSVWWNCAWVIEVLTRIIVGSWGWGGWRLQFTSRHFSSNRDISHFGAKVTHIFWTWSLWELHLLENTPNRRNTHILHDSWDWNRVKQPCNTCYEKTVKEKFVQWPKCSYPNEIGWGKEKEKVWHNSQPM